MTILEQVLKANGKFVSGIPEEASGFSREKMASAPSRELVIFTCMDTRLVEYLEPAMGIKRGEAIIIKNAGNSVTRPFGATIRSLVMSVFELGAKEIMVIGHKDCGLSKTSAGELKEKMLKRGISLDAIKMIEDQLETWLNQFQDPEANIIGVVNKIKNNSLIPEDVPVHGLIFDPHNGNLEVLVNGYSP